MPQGKCQVDGCDKPVRARGWCITHYTRWKKHGDPGTADLQRPPSYNGVSCSVSGCERTVLARGWCGKHYQRWAAHGDPLTRHPSNKNAWRGDDVGYHGAHKRVAKERGRANEHLCVDCGETAAQWSFNHRTVSAQLSSALGPYSTNIMDFSPRCTGCHIKYDDRSRL